MIQISSTNYQPELFGMEDPSFFDDQEYTMDSFAFHFDDIDFKPFSASPESFSSHNSNHKRFNSESPNLSVASVQPTKQLKTTWNNTYGSDSMNMNIIPKASNSSPSSKIISFDFDHSNTSSVSSQQFYNMVKKPKTEIAYGKNLNFEAVISQGDYDNKLENKVSTTTTTQRNSIQARDHVMAERKRREKLSQKFIVLSSMIPGLKKMDKATILEDAISYLKQLKERVNTLEEQAAVDRTVESAVFAKRSILFADDDHNSSCDENTDQSVPKIEARVSGKDMLFRIYCDKHNGRAATAILCELEKHHLTIQSSCAFPFGNNYLDITIVAKMNKEYCLTIKDLIRSISQVLRQLI